MNGWLRAGWFGSVVATVAIAATVLAACRERPAGTPPTDPTQYLELAHEAERWIESTRVDTARGVAWPDVAEDPSTVGVSLYYGNAGTLVFYLELYRATGERRFLERATAGARDLEVRAAASADLSSSLYSGRSGVAFALYEVYRASGDPLLLEASRAAFERVHAVADKIAQEGGDGLRWLEPMPFSDSLGGGGLAEVLDVASGAAGIGLAFLYAHENGIHPDTLAWARQVGDRLIEVAEPTAAGLQWQMVTEMPREWTAPNFSHGTSGVAYFLARLHEATGEGRYLAAALAGAAQLRAIATTIPGTGGTPDKDRDGRLIYHHAGDGEDLFYLSWCHGPAGTGRLYHQLGRVTLDSDWDESVALGARAILALGAPEQRSPGFWNNVSQCCGDAGAGELGLELYEESADPGYLDLAKRVAASIAARGEQAAAGICWVQAEHRSRPDFLVAHTGYMQGAAGIGSFLVHLHDVVSGARVPSKIPFPDSPWR